MVSRCFSGGYNVKLYISRGWLAWWLLAFFAEWYGKVTLILYKSYKCDIFLQGEGRGGEGGGWAGVGK